MCNAPAKKPDWKIEELTNDKRLVAGVVSHLQETGDWKTADRIDRCAGSVERRVVDGKTTYKFITCHKHKLCTICNKIRFYKIGKNLNEKILNAGIEDLHTKHLVLTIKNSKQMKNRFEYMAECKKKLRILRARGKISEWSNVASAFGSIECSIDYQDQDKYHVHIHIVTYSHDDLDVNLLREEWRKIAGEGSHLNENIIEDNGYHLNNIISYINKLPELPDVKDRVKWDETTHGKHMFFTWGEIRKAKVTPKKKYVHGFNRIPNAQYEKYNFAGDEYTNDSDDIEANTHHIDDSEMEGWSDFIDFKM